jgi:hypothetical protein
MLLCFVLVLFIISPLQLNFFSLPMTISGSWNPEKETLPSHLLLTLEKIPIFLTGIFGNPSPDN